MIWFASYVPDSGEQAQGCVHLCIIRGMHLWLIREAFRFLPLVSFFIIIIAIPRGCLVLIAIFPLFGFSFPLFFFFFCFSSLHRNMFPFLPCAATFCCTFFCVCMRGLESGALLCGKCERNIVIASS